MPTHVDEWIGLARSLITYWRPGRQRGLRRLYRAFVRPGDLVFDVGAHLGDRTMAFAALGATVIALEPQPRVARLLRRLVPTHAAVTVRTEAVGADVGVAPLAISRRTPTVSTLSDAWRHQVPTANPTFRHVRWEQSVDVPVTTLDALIHTYGVPRFCKIDVEGYEPEVLAGLSHGIPGLSVEFVSGSLASTRTCVERLQKLGDYEFNAVPGERRQFLFDQWLTADETLAWVAEGAGDVSSGDLYARHRRPGATMMPKDSSVATTDRSRSPR